MNFLKEWAVVFLTIACVLCIFLGYFWRMYHEVKNWDKWRVQAIRSFLIELEEEQATQFRFDRWEFIKRGDGSIVIRKR